MNPKIIIAAGSLAAGKTTFARRISKELNVPAFCKDELKTALYPNLAVSGREASKRLSAAVFDAMLFIAERFMETGRPLIMEANFVMDKNHGGRREGAEILHLTRQYGYKTLTFLFSGDTQVLCRRFNERENSPERGAANRLGGAMGCEDFEKTAKRLAAFDIGGERITVDTTDFSAVNYDRLAEAAHRFLDENR